MSKKNAIAKIGHAIVSFDGAGIGHLLTVQEVAGLLRCSVSSLNKWRLTGSGPPFVRVGSRVRYRTSDLNTYIAGRTVTSTSEKFPSLQASTAILELSPRRRGILETDLQDWRHRRRRSPPREVRGPPSSESMNP